MCMNLRDYFWYFLVDYCLMFGVGCVFSSVLAHSGRIVSQQT